MVCKNCKNCKNNKNPTSIYQMNPLVYQYYLETNWLNYATTDGWGAYNGVSQSSNNTRDNEDGFGINADSIPNGKKLKIVYYYNNIQYLNPYSIVIDNITNLPTPVYEANGVIRKAQIITV